jgi:hypothetical protein
LYGLITKSTIPGTKLTMSGDSGKNKGSSGAGGNGFKGLGLSEEIFKAIVRMGYRVRSKKDANVPFYLFYFCFVFPPEIFNNRFLSFPIQMPTPVQRKALPVVLTGADACVMVSSYGYLLVFVFFHRFA